MPVPRSASHFPWFKREMAIPMHSQETFREIIAAIHNAGLQADVHAVGDKGVDWTLDAFARAAGSDAAVMERRHRIEHFPFRRSESIKRAAAMNVPVCQQPYFIDSFIEALRIHTAGSAYAAFDENELGTLTVGKQADFAVWNRDLRTVRSAADLAGLAVEGTFLAGRCVYGA